MSLRSIILATAALCAYTNAHITMESPVPFSADKITSDPISAENFPCKSKLGFTVTKMNAMAVGEQQTISFKGTAVHGGGSCQLSVTTDTEPTENSKFKVIKSIEGGCPGVDGTTNSYQFEIPDSVPNGKATFAWTWFSKMSGAPELYMNCAPIEVTGGASDTTAFDALPDMFKANIGEGCTSPQNFATEFPDAGSNVQMGGTNDLKTPTGSCGASGTPANPSAPAGSGAPASSAASAAPSSAGNDGQYTPPAGAAPTSAAVVPTSAAAAPTSAAVAPTSAAAAPTSAAGSAPGYSAAPPAATPSAAPSGTAGGIFAPGASSAPVAASTQTTLVTVTGTPSTPSKTPVASAPSASKPAASAPSATKPVASAPAAGTGTAPAPTTAPSAGGSGTCTTDGAVVCNGPSQFGLCNGGKVVWQAVAAGTTCTNGTIAKRGYNGRIVRRNRSFIGHVHKH
ncbi:hypothetical protein C7974DRAFT_398893 [Boeremia exigua]|uniref:uncharacterized protein n=1 Tax=Boeremia exigua TaxID=749465 RepID=UPI001E8D312D|nr:uncharacterized protein C7974DRAFT_398893 [Boeremia exigua]KAH6620096.1 hypothetical protein C7974DRAFT_398893 [Boeremia exigua]